MALNPKIKELRYGERDATVYMIMFLLHLEPHFKSTSNFKFTLQVSGALLPHQTLAEQCPGESR